jgi:hypothetical protein
MGIHLGIPPVSIMGHDDSTKTCSGCTKRIRQAERFLTDAEGRIWHQRCFREKTRNESS